MEAASLCLAGCCTKGEGLTGSKLPSGEGEARHAKCGTCFVMLRCERWLCRGVSLRLRIMNK